MFSFTRTGAARRSLLTSDVRSYLCKIKKFVLLIHSKFQFEARNRRHSHQAKIAIFLQETCLIAYSSLHSFFEFELEFDTGLYNKSLTLQRIFLLNIVKVNMTVRVPGPGPCDVLQIQCLTLL